MAPVRPEGPYPPVEDESNKVVRELIKLTKMLKKTPLDQLFDYKPIKVQLDRLEALVATSQNLNTDKEMDRNKAQTRFGQIYGSDKDKEMYRVKATTETFNGHIEDLEGWMDSLEDGELNAVLAYLTKKEMEELKNMSEEEIIYNPHGEYDGMDLAAGKSKTVYTYRHNGKVDVLDLHDAPRFRLIYWQNRFKATREELEKQGIPNKIKPRQLWELEIDVLKSMELDLAVQIHMSKAVSADPHKWPGPAPCGVQPSKPWPRIEQSVEMTVCDGATQEEKDAFEKDLQRRAIEEERKFQKTAGAMPSDPKLTIIPNYSEYVAKRDKQLKKERKKRNVYKVITVVSKVIIASLLIYIGLIIMENILAGKPISTYLNRILTGE